MGRRINTIMQTAFFHLAGVIDGEQAVKAIKKAIEKTYMKKGIEIVEKNYKAVDNAISNLYEVEIPSKVSEDARPRPSVVSSDASDVVKRLHAKIIAGEGNDLPVSAFDADGTFPTATSKYEKRGIAVDVPDWDATKCIECNQCSYVCPHAAIRPVAMTAEEAANASFKKSCVFFKQRARVIFL